MAQGKPVLLCSLMLCLLAFDCRTAWEAGEKETAPAGGGAQRVLPDQKSAWERCVQEGREYAKSSNYSSASACLRRAYRIARRAFGPAESRTLETLEELVEIYCASGQDKLARKAAAKMRAAKRTDVEFFLLSARVAEKVGDRPGAEAALKAAVAAAPQDPRAFMRLGAFYRSEDEYALAAEMYEKAWALNPGDYAAGVELAACYRRMGRPGDAQEIYSMLSGVCPDCPKVFIESGYAALNRGEDEKALASFRTAADVAPGDSEPYHHLGVFFYVRREYAEAERLFERALEILDDSPRADPGRITHSLVYLAKAYCASGEAEKIKPLFSRAAELAQAAPEDYIVVQRAGQIAAMIAYYGQARSFYERALGDLAPERRADQALVKIQIAQTYVGEGDFAQADRIYRELGGKRDVFRKYAKDDKFFGRILVGLGDLLLDMKRDEEAKPYYEEVLDILKGSPHDVLYQHSAERLSLIQERGASKPRPAGR